jgi:protein ImuA
MPSPDRRQRLAALRERIADIECKPALAEARARPDLRQGDKSLADFPHFAGGLLQEIFTEEHRNAGAPLGFALGQARGLLNGQKLAVVYLQLAGEGQLLGLPYGPGLDHFGFDPAALVLVRAADMAELLWAAEEAVACRAVAAVVADIGGRARLLDFTASRRLSLRAAGAGSSIFLLRYGAERAASAAQLRWQVSPARSGRRRWDAGAPGPQRWRVELEKGAGFTHHAAWLLEWTENGFAATRPADDDAGQSRRSAPFPRAVPARLADRLSQAG